MACPAHGRAVSIIFNFRNGRHVRAAGSNLYRFRRTSRSAEFVEHIRRSRPCLSLVRITYPSRPETDGFAGLKGDLSVNLKLFAGFKTIACDELQQDPTERSRYVFSRRISENVLSYQSLIETVISAPQEDELFEQDFKSKLSRRHSARRMYSAYDSFLPS